MAEILNFEDHYSNRFAAKIVGEIGELYGQAGEIARHYSQLMEEDPLNAITQLQVYIDKARDLNPDRSFVEAVAGGPNQDWTAPMIDIVGIVYPVLEKPARKDALSRCLNYLDHLNYFNSQDHVELLNEPWMVADIVINRPLYWSGFKEYSNLLEKHRTWGSLYPHLEQTRSAFWLSMAVIRTEFASDEVKDNFYRLFPTLTDRTLDAVAALTATHAENDTRKKGIPIRDGVESRLFKYDHRFHKDIMKKIEERKWIILDKTT